MIAEKVEFIFNQFKHDSTFVKHHELESGHINDTYLVTTKNKPYFILQRVNHNIFKDVPGLINNKLHVSLHVKEKLKHLPQNELNRRVLSFVKTKADQAYYRGDDGNYWNLMYYIDNSYTYETVKDEEIAFEGGKLFGEFLNLTHDFPVSKLTEVIPKFHDMSFRYAQFESALNSASKQRLDHAKLYIERVADMKEEMHILQHLKESGDIPLRVTHNDTKISNALFSKNNKGLCVIDTDTVMPGIVHYDFGDAIRTICNTAAEDETNLDIVEFNLDYYKAYKKGFLEKMNDTLTPTEIDYLPLAAKTMTFIMALRFLTDYLNNDIYYKTKYQEHNFDRAKNQFKLIDSFTERYNQL